MVLSVFYLLYIKFCIQVPENHYKNIIWYFHVHAILAKQRAPKLNHQLASIYPWVADITNNGIGKSASDRIEQKAAGLPILGVSLCSTMVDVLLQEGFGL